MVENKFNIPFPQADDFEKVIDLLNIEEEKNLKDTSKISACLNGVTDRQVSYYLSACIYLGLINHERQFTTKGLNFRKLDRCKQNIEMLRILISDEIIGTAYLTEKNFGFKLGFEDLMHFISKYYPSYSYSSLRRRSLSLRKWMEWIDKNIHG